MRTQIAKTGYLPAEYILPTFSTRTPSPYSAGWRWGLLSRKIFSDFFSDSIINSFWLYFEFYFFWFRSYSQNVWIENNFFIFFSWLRSYSDSYSILFRISVVSTRYKFCSIFTRLWFSYSLLIFYSHQFRLVSALPIIHFDS